MSKHYLIWGFSFGLISIILGAFAAHALKEILTVQQLESFNTGVRYQMYHALLLVILSQLKFAHSKVLLYLIVLGVFLFSFSIYLLNLKATLNAPFLVALGPITPIGGLLLISAWSILLVKSISTNSAQA